jgi:hypothetical protein
MQVPITVRLLCTAIFVVSGESHTQLRELNDKLLFQNRKLHSSVKLSRRFVILINFERYDGRVVIRYLEEPIYEGFSPQKVFLLFCLLLSVSAKLAFHSMTFAVE